MSDMIQDDDPQTHTYDPTQPHYWRQLGHSDAANSAVKRTVDTAQHQGWYDDGYAEGVYQIGVLENEGGNTPVSGI